MMDPLSAFGLACGIVQIVDFSSKILSESKELWKNGNTKANEDLEDITKWIGDMQLALEPPSGQANAGRVSQQAETELLELARNCKEVSDELLAELEDLKPNRKREIPLKSVKRIRRRSTLDEMKRKMDSFRKFLDTRILIDLRNEILCL